MLGRARKTCNGLRRLGAVCEVTSDKLIIIIINESADLKKEGTASYLKWTV